MIMPRRQKKKLGPEKKEGKRRKNQPRVVVALVGREVRTAVWNSPNMPNMTQNVPAV